MVVPIEWMIPNNLQVIRYKVKVKLLSCQLDVERTFAWKLPNVVRL